MHTATLVAYQDRSLYINNVDHSLLELLVSWEDLYQAFACSVNAIIPTYFSRALGDAQVYSDHDTITLVPASTASASLSASLPLSTLRSSMLTIRRFSTVYVTRSLRVTVSRTSWADTYLL